MSYIHSSVTGHLSCFDILALRINAAGTLEFRYFIKTLDYHPLDKYPELGLLHMKLFLWLII